jgi:proline dehydrogenase
MHFSRRWIAGTRLFDAMQYAKELNKNNTKAVINILGENAVNPERIRRTTINYLILMRQIKKDKINAEISVKLTQLGLMVHEKFCIENMEKILEYAKKNGVFVWIESEGIEFAEKTIKVYFELIKKYDNCGITIQSHLWRSEADLIKIIKNCGHVKLVKGYEGDVDPDKNFKLLMKILFERSNNFAIAVYDEKIIRNAMNYGKNADKNFEFHFVMGVPMNRKMCKKYKIAEYVPFGKKWKEYVDKMLNG